MPHMYYIWTTGKWDFWCPEAVYKCLWETSPSSRRLPEALVWSVLEERLDLILPAILQYVAGETRWKIQCDPAHWCVNILQHRGLPPSCRWATPTFDTCQSRERSTEMLNFIERMTYAIHYPMILAHSGVVNVSKSLLKPGNSRTRLSLFYYAIRT